MRIYTSFMWPRMGVRVELLLRMQVLWQMRNCDLKKDVAPWN